MLGFANTVDNFFMFYFYMFILKDFEKRLIEVLKLPSTHWKLYVLKVRTFDKKYKTNVQKI